MTRHLLFKGGVELGLFLVGLLVIGFVHAENYPTKPIRLIVPYPPAGGVDGVARIAFKRISEVLGQSVVIDNRGGSSGVIAAETAVHAPADGYTLFFGTTSTQVITPQYYRKLTYDPLKDFEPINLIAGAGYMLVVTPSLAVTSVKELVALAKAKPGVLNFSSAGNGSTLHLTTELFNMTAGLKMLHVPYKGSAPALADLLSGQIQLTFNPASVVLSLVKMGRLRALGISSAKRSALAPELPTIAEAGMPGFEASGWYGVLGPAHLNKALIQTLNQAINLSLTDKEVKERFAATGVEAIGLSAQQFDRYIREEYDKWGKVIRVAGVKAE